MKKGILILSLFVSSCMDHDVKVTDTGVEIEFGVSNIDVSADVRSVMDQDAVDNGKVYVFATRNNAELYENEPVVRDNIGRWLPENDSQIKRWEKGCRYVFYGYASSPAPSSAANSPLALTENADGLQISVNQPATYLPDEMVDYLLSHIMNVTDGALRPVVNLYMEHAMSLVEIQVVKSSSISDAYVKRITISGFNRSADMQCTQAVINSGNTNVWDVDFKDNTGNLTEYNIEFPDIGERLVSSDDSPVSQMKFMAIPQQLDDQVLLSVTYYVNEKSSESEPDNLVAHTDEFRLFNFNPVKWSSGHRIRYVLTVDTGIHLYGSIVPWKEIDAIEGTVLPEIPTDSENED